MLEALPRRSLGFGRHGVGSTKFNSLLRSLLQSEVLHNAGRGKISDTAKMKGS